MTAIDKNLLENHELLSAAQRLRKAGFITEPRFVYVKAKLDVPKSQDNLLVRIGFFLLGFLLYMSVQAVLAMFFFTALNAIGAGEKVLSFFFAMVGMTMTELLARNNFYRHGLDDAFILLSQSALYIAVGMTTQSIPMVFFAMAVFGLMACIRYVNLFMAIVSVVGIAGFFASLIIEYKIISTAFLPIVMFLIALALYGVSRRLDKNESLFLYADSIAAVRILSYILGYLSLNYLIVRELSGILLELRLQPGEDIPLAMLFYAATILIPVLYLIFGVRNKDRGMFNVGILAAAFSIFTIRHYYSVMPIEIALTLGGVILFAATYLFIRKIRNNDAGVTFKPDRYTDSEALVLAQAAIINSQAHIRTVQTTDPAMPFGGGGFSGGGAGKSY